MPHPTSRARRFPTANVTNLPGGATNVAAGGLLPQRNVTLPSPPPRPRTRPAGVESTLPVQAPLPLPALGQFRAVQTPRPPQAASFGSSDPRVQALIDQIARTTNSGAQRTQFSSSAFSGGRRGDDQRTAIEALIAQLTSGEFAFDASTDPEARAFRVARERARAEAQVGLSERLAADPANTGGFAVDRRALREQTGESIARFSAGRASQRRGEVLGERTSALAAALSNLGLTQSQATARANAELRERQGAQGSQQALLQALLGEQARVQGGQASAGQQVFANELSSARFESGQGNASRQAEQDVFARAVQQQQTQQQLRRDALAEQQARQDEEFRRRQEERVAQDRRDRRRREQEEELERQRRQVHQQHGHDHG